VGGAAAQGLVRVLFHQRNAHLAEGVLAARLPPERRRLRLPGRGPLEGCSCLCEARCSVQGCRMGKGSWRRHSGSCSSGYTCACGTEAPGQTPGEAAKAHRGGPLRLLLLLLLLGLLGTGSGSSKGGVQAVARVLGAFETPRLLLGRPPGPPPLTTRRCCGATCVAAAVVAAVAGVSAACGTGGAASPKAVVLCCLLVCVVTRLHTHLQVQQHAGHIASSPSYQGMTRTRAWDA
jgi:hypothetical protein